MKKNKARQEMAYNMTMVMAKSLLEKGTITKDEYADFHAKILKKYNLKNSSLFADINLL
mgnify:CR=1 FL=1